LDENGVGIIETVHGYKDGKLQTGRRTITEGKNRGKKNETTPYQQAQLEAQSAWQKKCEEGYRVATTVTVPAPVSTTNKKPVNQDVPSPMLAHDYTKRGSSIQFPCYVQPKLDGVRCIASNRGLFSRNRKPFPHCEHIQQEIISLWGDDILWLDGELYSETLGFQEIVGLVKKETLTANDQEKIHHIHYYIYDVILKSAESFEHRLAVLRDRVMGTYLHIVSTELCEGANQIKEKHDIYVSQGYEGLMLRNRHSPYQYNRSVHLQKYKEFQEEEYEIVGFTSGQGLEEGCILWICQTTDKKTFQCRPRGTREDRQEWMTRGTSFVGKKLTVRFQELTEDGLPRFPVGISIREEYE
jgi:DNA ligase-1